MNPLSKIIVATDFSARANRAVRRAAKLAHDHKAALHLLFVVERQPLEALRNLISVVSGETEDKLHASIESKMRELAEVLHTHFGVSAESRVVVGAVYAEIVAQVANEDADLLVIGAHGEHYVEDMFIGSSASKIIRTVTAPVLIVRNEEVERYSQVLVAVDFSPMAMCAMRLARSLGHEAKIHPMHAVEIPFEGRLQSAGVSAESIQKYRSRVVFEARRHMDQFLEQLAELETESPVVAYGRVPVVLTEQCALLNPDLIVVGRHGEAGEIGLLLGSITKHAVYEASCDVLVVS